MCLLQLVTIAKGGSGDVSPRFWVEVSDSIRAPAALTLAKWFRYPLNGRLGGRCGEGNLFFLQNLIQTGYDLGRLFQVYLLVSQTARSPSRSGASSYCSTVMSVCMVTLAAGCRYITRWMLLFASSVLRHAVADVSEQPPFSTRMPIT
jgi:hypothetical protein